MKLKALSLTVIAILVPVFSTSAQVLEKIPGQAPVAAGDLIGYLNNIYKFGISITGILAVFMIALSSFSYIVTSVGNSSKMMDAKERIQNALIGLVIALTAYLLLYVINPDLISGTLNMPGATIEEIVSLGTLANGAPCNKALAGGAFSNPALTSCSECTGGVATLTLPATDYICGNGW